MSSLFDPRNPKSEAQLLGLANSLPGMVQEQLNSRKKKSGLSKGFTRFCPICSLEYERSKIYSAPEMKEGVCEGCRENLTGGFFAVVTVSKRYGFVKFPELTREQFRKVARFPETSDDDRKLLLKLADAEGGSTVLLSDDEMNAVQQMNGEQQGEKN